MTGRGEVARLKSRLDATFKRADGLRADAELLSDFARHLCVLVSGFLEQAIIELLLEHVRNNASESVQRHVERRLRSFTNAGSERILELFGSFDADWRKDLEGFLVDEYKDAVNSVVDQRHHVAHGRFTGITFVRVKEYYTRIVKVVDHLADLCDPPRAV